MKKIFRLLILLITVGITNTASAQFADPAVSASAQTTTPIACGATQDISFNFFNVSSTQTLGLFPPTSLSVQLSKMIVPGTFNPASITGAGAAYFTWTYDATNNLLSGTLNTAVPPNGGGAINITGLLVNGTSLQSNPQTGFNVNINATGSNNASTLNDFVSTFTYSTPPTAATVGTIVQPTCALATGTVTLNGLPSSGTWTLTRSPGAVITTGTGTSTTISGLAAGTYTYTVTNTAGCSSASSANVVINAQPATPTAATVGTIVQPTCAVATGSVTLNGLPSSGTWTLTRNPGSVTTTGTGTSTTISGLVAGTYTYTITNAVGCPSAASANVLINAQPATPTATTIGTIVQPTCAVATGTVTLNGLPSTGNWTLTRTPGAVTTTGSGISTTITGLVNGTYTYTVTNDLGCVSAPSANVVINSQPQTPSSSPTVLTAYSNICPALTANLDSAITSTTPAGLTIEWFTNNAATGVAYATPTTAVAGTYYAFYKNISGCYSSASSPVAVTISSCLNPDFNVTDVNVTTAGDLAANNALLPGTTFGTPVAVAGNPNGALPVMNPNGTYTFMSALPGKYSYLVPVCAVGQTSNCPTELLTITVLDPVNQTSAPIANTDIALTKGTMPITIPVKENDGVTNPNGSLGNPTIVTPPSNGTAVVNPDGTITYTPTTPGFVGKDTVVYQVCDTVLMPAKCDDAVLIVSVNPANAPNGILAADDYISTVGTSPATGNVSVNDTDPEGNTKTVTAQTVTTPQGVLTLNTNGTYSFVPTGTFDTTVSFVYQVCDNGTPQACANATLYIKMGTVKPDLTPVISTVPAITNGIQNVNAYMNVYEINNKSTNSVITVYISKDTRYNIVYNNTLTMLGGVSVDNTAWTLDSTTSPFFYIFTSNTVMPGFSGLGFGYSFIFDPQSSNGQTTISATILAESGGEINDLNNSDNTSLNYFIN